MGNIMGKSGRALAVLAVLGLAVLLTGQPGVAQVKKGKTHLAETKFLMRGINQPNCAAIGGLLKDKGPADDKAWEQVLCHAETLNEMSYVLMADGRCPDKDWAAAAKTLGECSGKVAEAAAAKKLENAQTAFKALTGACSACHKAHKGK